MGVASAQFLRALILDRPRESSRSERLEMQETILNVAKIIGELALRKSEKSPRKPQAADNKRPASQNE